MGLSDSIENRLNGLFMGNREMRRRLQGTKRNLAKGADGSLRTGIRWPFMLLCWTNEDGEPLLRCVGYGRTLIRGQLRAGHGWGIELFIRGATDAAITSSGHEGDIEVG